VRHQIRQSLIAGPGGIWGKARTREPDAGHSAHPIPLHLRSLREEHGFVGAPGVLLLYFLILSGLIQNAQTAADARDLLTGGFLRISSFRSPVSAWPGLMPVQ
jgi:rod shape determining protein RodA